jgi:hypothetical protein
MQLSTGEDMKVAFSGGLGGVAAVGGGLCVRLRQAGNGYGGGAALKCSHPQYSIDSSSSPSLCNGLGRAAPLRRARLLRLLVLPLGAAAASTRLPRTPPLLRRPVAAASEPSGGCAVVPEERLRRLRRTPSPRSVASVVWGFVAAAAAAAGRCFGALLRRLRLRCTGRYFVSSS